jgi:allantoicase
MTAAASPPGFEPGAVLTGQPGQLGAESEWLPDLASRQLGGSVVAASDELFAEKENLIRPSPPVFSPAAFGNKGKVYDGWETRRRREPGYDWAIVRLGCPGIVRGVLVDTAFFRGNFPPEISVEAACADGYPGPGELAGMSWTTLVGRTRAAGDTVNRYEVTDGHRWTHIRLSIYPDGGVARLRVHGDVIPDPAFLTGIVDLAAAEHGALVTDCSDAFYSRPGNLLLPGRARDMSEGWENARRRDRGHDHVTIRLAALGAPQYAEIDTSCFIGNAPGWIRLLGTDDPDAAAAVGLTEAGPPAGWWDILPRMRVQPDTRHRFRAGATPPAIAVRLDVYPDGGLSRLRIFGEIDPAALDQLRRRWDELRHAGGPG